MKEYITEVARLQKLAGISKKNVHEEEAPSTSTSAIPDSEIAKAISIATNGAVPPDAVNVSKLKSNPDDPNAIDKSKVKKESKKSQEDNINEVALSVTLALLAPAILNLLGNKINKLKQDNDTVYMSGAEREKVEKMNAEIEDLKKLRDKYDKENLHDKESEVIEKIHHIEHERDKISGFKVGNWLKTAGHTLHKVYVWPIKAILDAKAFYNRAFNKERGKTNSRFNTDEKYRENIANVIYCAIMIFVSLKSFLAHPAEAASQLSKNTGGMISVSTISSLLSHVKTAKTAKEAITSAMDAI